MKIKSTFFCFFIFLISLFSQPYKEALFWKILDEKEKIIQCVLCPRECILKPNQSGYCTVRINIDGKLYTLTYNHPVSIAVDPIEKKPVFHMLPASKSFSLATAGCNLRCIHCQNWEISQRPINEIKYYKITPQEIVKMAIETGCQSISYTYTEPVIFYEYMLDIAKEAKKRKIKNVMVTSGYINLEPLDELIKYIDVFRVDLKGFSEEFYKKLAAGKLQPVLEMLKYLKQKGAFIEVVNLIIPTMNDDPQDIRKMCIWIKQNLSDETPLFFSRFYPMYKLKNLPATPIETLEKAYKIAKEVGLKYVYIGNVPGHPYESTYCPNCKKILIKRVGYNVLANNIIQGKCKFCNTKIPGIWE
ncbi:MAG: AmmeMemoRadiSam system radical SAM enzyme [Elusimicrobiota bacterium]|nr:AmmeMemoRadiSam system radical SAM enzyme [Endomicrobiia bacterium]MDW8165605.1 AmmeMemoRadiSam system radical SAM enzyme [Elusimicrobiota bacterium]